MVYLSALLPPLSYYFNPPIILSPPLIPNGTQISLVTAPLCRGLNGAPASQEILPGLARLLALLIAFTFSVVRLPTLWAAHTVFTYRPKEHTHRSGPSRGGGNGGALRRDVSNCHGSGHGNGHTKD